MANRSTQSTSQAIHSGGIASLTFRPSPDAKTYLAHQYVGYPFHITRPFYLEGDPPGMPTLYLQSVAGGIFGGDTTELRIHGEADSVAQVTTQASTVCHSMSSAHAVQRVSLHTDTRSFLEYLPDPVILFPHAHLLSETTVEWHPSATAVFCDGYIHHDPTGAAQAFGSLSTCVSVKDGDGQLLCRDRFAITGDNDGVLPWGTRMIHGSVFCLQQNCPPSWLDAMRVAIANVDGVYAGASRLPNDCGIWTRLVADNSQALKDAQFAVWSAIRYCLFQLRPHRRRK